MKIIRNRFIPFKGIAAINLFGVLFVRQEARIDFVTLNHEEIHTAQMKEMYYIFFYLWYLLEWGIRLFMSGNAYRNISFEREASGNQWDRKYVQSRRPFAWVRYLKIQYYAQ